MNHPRDFKHGLKKRESSRGSPRTIRKSIQNEIASQSPLANLATTKKDFKHKYFVRDVIAQGSTSIVYEATQLGDDAMEPVCVKMITLPIAETKFLRTELAIFRHIKHENILKMNELFVHSKYIAMVLENCPPGSLMDIYTGRMEPFTEEQTIFICHSILNAISFLVSHGVVHRDIKGANIMLSSSGIVKLGDFGCSGLLDKYGQCHSYVGSVHWMAPEIIVCAALENQAYDQKVDIWSLGITAIECCLGAPPWFEYDPKESLYLIPSHPSPKIGEGFSSEFSAFVDMCLLKDPKQRPNAVDLLKHPVFTKRNFDEINPLIEIAQSIDTWVGWSWEESESDEMDKAIEDIQSHPKDTKSELEIFLSDVSNLNKFKHFLTKQSTHFKTYLSCWVCIQEFIQLPPNEMPSRARLIHKKYLASQKIKLPASYISLLREMIFDKQEFKSHMFTDLAQFLLHSLESAECWGKFQKREQANRKYASEEVPKKRSKDSIAKKLDEREDRSFPLQEFLTAHESNVKLFLDHLRASKHNYLNVSRAQCWQAIQQFKTIPKEDLESSATALYETYISDASPAFIEVPQMYISILQYAITTVKDYNHNMFHNLESHLLDNLAKECWSGFQAKNKIVTKQQRLPIKLVPSGPQQLIFKRGGSVESVQSTEKSVSPSVSHMDESSSPREPLPSPTHTENPQDNAASSEDNRSRLLKNKSARTSGKMTEDDMRTADDSPPTEERGIKLTSSPLGRRAKSKESRREVAVSGVRSSESVERRSKHSSFDLPSKSKSRGELKTDFLQDNKSSSLKKRSSESLASSGSKFEITESKKLSEPLKVTRLKDGLSLSDSPIAKRKIQSMDPRIESEKRKPELSSSAGTRLELLTSNKKSDPTPEKKNEELPRITTCVGSQLIIPETMPPLPPSIPINELSLSGKIEIPQGPIIEVIKKKPEIAPLRIDLVLEAKSKMQQDTNEIDLAGRVIDLPTNRKVGENVAIQSLSSRGTLTDAKRRQYQRNQARPSSWFTGS